MGLDEALLESAAAGSLPALRFYGWNPPAVSVGYFQGLTEEVDLDACARLGFDVVRRISGGGAVLHQSELTYSLILPLAHPLAEGDLGASYRRLCSGLIAGFARLGLEAVFSGVNDITVNGKKMSGNAQTRRLNCLLQHGTVLLDGDSGAMFEVLKIPKEKMSGRPAGEAGERVTNLKALLSREVPFGEAAPVFAEGFASALGLVLCPDSPRPEEEERALTLGRDKFSAREWLYKR